MMFRAISRYPFTAAVTITTAKTVAADLTVQLAVEQRPWDEQRTALFAAFGCIYQGGFQYAVVNRVLEPLFPGKSARNILLKIVGMNFVSDPFFFLPTFYIFRAAVEQKKIDDRTVVTALVNYRTNCVQDWCNSWMVWFPGHAVTYGVMPPAWRLPWMSILSFGYVMLLSFTRGDMEGPRKPQLTRRFQSHGILHERPGEQKEVLR
jgi:hypothetical protein